MKWNYPGQPTSSVRIPPGHMKAQGLAADWFRAFNKGA